MSFDRMGLDCYTLMKARRIEEEMLKKIHRILNKCCTPELVSGAGDEAPGMEIQMLKTSKTQRVFCNSNSVY